MDDGLSTFDCARKEAARNWEPATFGVKPEFGEHTQG
jgi:hypothetical protein